MHDRLRPACVTRAPSASALLGLLLAALACCTRAPGVATGDPPAPTGSPAAPRAKLPTLSPSAAAPEPARDPVEADGNDDPVDTGAGAIPATGRFTRVGRAPLALTRICSLVPFGGALYAAHARAPLGTDGATLTRYEPGAQHPFSVALDWNRPGEPARGGGAGQGFLRVRAIGGRLFAPDADPPYDGFHLVDAGTEGYVFVSDHQGRFARPLAPHFRPPRPPDGEDRAGAGIAPRAYHDFDVIRYRGRTYLSTGSVPPTARAWHGPSPGALHVASADLARWTYEVDYPFPPYRDGVWRLTYLVRFKGHLLAGIQDYDGREPNDYLLFDPPAGASELRRADAHPFDIVGGARTQRWYADAPPGRAPRLFWIAAARDGVRLRVSDDGELWTEVNLPPEAELPTDITRFRDGLVVLTERKLLRLADDLTSTEIASIDGAVSPFRNDDMFCSAPLAVLDDELYAGGQIDGSLYKLVAGVPGRGP